MTQDKVLTLKTTPDLQEGKKGRGKVGNLSALHQKLLYPPAPMDSVTMSNTRGLLLHWALRPMISELLFSLKLYFPTVDFANGDIAFYLTIGSRRSHFHWE